MCGERKISCALSDMPSHFFHFTPVGVLQDCGIVTSRIRGWKDGTNKLFNQQFFNIALGDHTRVELRSI